MKFQLKLVFALLGFATIGFLALAWETATAKPQASRPNILLLIADDWAWPHAGAYGDKVVKTPTFDRVARDGALFRNAFSASPSCTPSRASPLTGRAVHQLEEGGNLWSALPGKFAVYPDLLEQAGYSVGFTRKGWGPGSIEAAGRKRNPAGSQFKSFEEFFKQLPSGKPFCFWFGSQDPHRPYDKGSGATSGLKAENVVVPAYLPDTPEVRNDLLDYYFEIERFDREIGEIIKTLEDAKLLDNTMVVITADNGLPFPRAKANVYDAGSHQPFAVRFPGKVKAGSVIDEFVVLTDLAPTFLEAAGLKALPEMTGRSFLPLLRGQKQIGRDKVFLERERHANVRRGDLSYPVRAIRTNDFLYIRNLRPDRWPAGDPTVYVAVGDFGDIDGGPSKELLLSRRDDPVISKFFKLATDKRSAEELYDLKKDFWQINNVAGMAEYAAAKKRLRAELDKWMRETKDPRASSDDDRWDQYRYFGNPDRGEAQRRN